MPPRELSEDAAMVERMERDGELEAVELRQREERERLAHAAKTAVIPDDQRISLASAAPKGYLHVRDVRAKRFKCALTRGPVEVISLESDGEVPPRHGLLGNLPPLPPPRVKSEPRSEGEEDTPRTQPTSAW